MLKKDDKNNPFTWDYHSDQPHIIRDKQFKKSLYRKGLIGTLKTFLAVTLLPATLIKFFRLEKYNAQEHDTDIGLAIHIESQLDEKNIVPLDQLIEMVNELGVQYLLIRIPLADIESLDKYITHIKAFDRQEIAVNILQDREHIESETLLTNNLRLIFSKLKDVVSNYQIGNAVNRRKWAFTSIDEYFNFYQTCERVKNEIAPEAKLLGGSIIDFEVPNFIRSLFHTKKLRYDGVASLLYVDRRGAPENTQLGFDLANKIRLFYAAMLSSKKSDNDFWITEINWPIEGTAPFSPAGEEVMVSEAKQADYLTRSLLLILASGKVSHCFWHQLVAPGYGLIDNRGTEIRKRPAYFCFKTLIAITKQASKISLQECNDFYLMRFSNSLGNVTALWTNDKTIEIDLEPLNISAKQAVNQFGESIDNNGLTKGHNFAVTGSVIYLLDYPESH